MGLVLKYAQELPSGAFRYRRRVPKALVATIGKGEFVQLLGDSRKAALRVYPTIHNAVELQLAVAARQLDGKPRSVDDQDSELAQYRRLEERIRGAGFDPAEAQASIGSNEGRQREADHVLDRHPRDLETGRPLLSDDEVSYVRALYNGPPIRPAPTLSDALRLYLAEKVTTASHEDHKKRQRVNRVVGNAIAALGGDRKVTDIHRTDAKAIRDHFLANSPSPDTAKRYLNDIRGILKYVIKEEEVDMLNPFVGLPVGDDPAHLERQRQEGRGSIPQADLDAAVVAVDERLRGHASVDLLNIWTLLSYTGCRMKEVTGLGRDDLVLEGKGAPYLSVHWAENRRLKNTSSSRDLPLVPAARSAAEDALSRAGTGAYLFPRYCDGQKGADRASAALMRVNAGRIPGQMGGVKAGQ